MAYLSTTNPLSEKVIGRAGENLAVGGLTLGDGTGAIATTSVNNTGVNAIAPTTNVATPSNAANVTIKASAGRLFGVAVTTAGTAAMTFTDNGVVIFALSAAQTAAIGFYPCNVIFNTNLVAVGAATNPSISSAIA